MLIGRLDAEEKKMQLDEPRPFVRADAIPRFPRDLADIDARKHRTERQPADERIGPALPQILARDDASIEIKIVGDHGARLVKHGVESSKNVIESSSVAHRSLERDPVDSFGLGLDRPAVGANHRVVATQLDASGVGEDPAEREQSRPVRSGRRRGVVGSRETARFAIEKEVHVTLPNPHERASRRPAASRRQYHAEVDSEYRDDQPVAARTSYGNDRIRRPGRQQPLGAAILRRENKCPCNLVLSN